MIFAIIISKILSLFLRLFNKGATSLPGKVALKIKSDILAGLSGGVRIICITGTNGKTTTCALVAHALDKSGCSYFVNKSGANMISGIVTSFIENSNLFGKCKKEFAVLECDENSLPLISKCINAEILLVTNIFRDQLDRYGETDATLKTIEKGIKNMPRAVLILNADDPVSYSLSKTKNRVVTFSVNADIKDGAASDLRYCPFCFSKLKYKRKTISHLGEFYCPECSYKSPSPDVEIKDITDNCFVINNEICATALKGLYNLYNFAAAAAVLSTLKVGEIKDLCTFSGAFGRMESFSVNNHTVLLLLVKNPVGFSSCIRYISSLKSDFNIAFALNDREADSTDVSWIWDCDFTPLSKKRSKVYTLGIRSFDMALRLKYDGISVSEILKGEDYKKLINIIKNADRDFVVFSSYTAMMSMRRQFISEFGGKEFWE